MHTTVTAPGGKERQESPRLRCWIPAKDQAVVVRDILRLHTDSNPAILGTKPETVMRHQSWRACLEGCLIGVLVDAPQNAGVLSRADAWPAC